MFFELRQYRMRPGQREKWVKFMEEEIIPFQVRQECIAKISSTPCTISLSARFAIARFSCSADVRQDYGNVSCR